MNLNHLKRPWCWERLKAGGEGDDRRWLHGITDSMDMSLGKVRELPGRPVMLRFMGSWGRKQSDTTEQLNWTELNAPFSRFSREFKWTPGVGDGQGGLACCDSWGPKESNTTEQLNWTEYMDVRAGLWRKLSAEKLVLLNCGVGEDSWESFGLQGDPTSPS